MKDIKKENIHDLKHVEIAQISQNQYQYDNYNITLYKAKEDGEEIKAGDMVIREDCISNSNDYILDKDEKCDAQIDFEAFLNGLASDWACNEEDIHLELIRWGLKSPEDDVRNETWQDACRVIIKETFGNHTPIDYARNENQEVMIFENYSTTQAWIDKQEKGTYHLRHGEAGRPVYYIVE